MDGVENAAVGSSHISVVKTDGTLWVWGDNSGGQMGVGNCRIEDSASYPQKLMKNVRATFSWFDTTFAIDNNYDLYVWGNEASVAPSDGALYRPDCIASQIQDVSYVGGLKYLPPVGRSLYSMLLRPRRNRHTKMRYCRMSWHKMSHNFVIRGS